MSTGFGPRWRVFGVALGVAACAPAVDVETPADAGTPPPAPKVMPKKLSELGLFDLTRGHDGPRLYPTPGNEPYELTTALFSDYALKYRTIRIPPDTRAVYEPAKVLEFPVGTLITKTFSFAADGRHPDDAVRIYETRVLVRQPSGWEAYPYVWTEDGADATYAPGGRVFDVSFVDALGTAHATKYLVPSRNQCQECHHFKGAGSDQTLTPIGPKARNLNRDHDYGGKIENQLEHLARAGLLEGLPTTVPRAPDAFDASTGDLDSRARTYLDVNCAHCHNPEGTAGVTSQLFLNIEVTDAFHLGACKRPGSAGADVGGRFDIVPGDHAASILWYRLQTTESGKMMPQLGRALRHVEGAQLVAEWIDAMAGRDCDGGP